MKVSVQIYSIREAGDLDAQLALARATGFEWIESVATHGLSADEFAAKLQGHGLRLSSMHVALALLEDEAGFERIVEACERTGCPLVVMPWLPVGERAATARGWQALGKRLAALGERFNARGLRFAYHNHDWEFLSFEGRTALDWIFSASTPALVGWEADLGWVRRGGLEPLDVVRRLRERLVSIHAKDIAADASAVAEDGWTALGQGIVGWSALLPALRSLEPRLDLVVFEHDKPVHFEATLRASREFLRESLGV